MEITHLDNAKPFDSEKFVAAPLLKGGRTTTVTIRLLPGQEMPGHTHGHAELVLYAAEGTATLDIGQGPVEFRAGSLTTLPGSETLTIRNNGTENVTLLAVLARPAA